MAGASSCWLQVWVTIAAKLNWDIMKLNTKQQ
jgi:tryptophan-rich sensory protein